MLLNYLQLALYNLKRYPLLSTIKILSLTIGLGCGLLVLMHAQYELSFDRHFEDGENVYRVVANSQGKALPNSGPRVLPALQKDYPEISYISRVRPATGTFKRGETSLTADYHWVEPDLLDIFSFQFISGDAATALDAPESLILSETAAAKFFPGEQALGQTLRLDDKSELRVTGVMRDLPPNTHFNLQVLINSDASVPVYGEHVIKDQRSFLAGMFTYMRLPDAATARTISADLVNFVERNLPDEQRDLATGNQFSLALEPLYDIHLGGRGDTAPNDSKVKVLLSLIAFAALILLTSCINFANLALVQVQQRSKEVGVRRALGATHAQIVAQFLLDALLATLLAVALALPAIELLLPVYTALTESSFSFATAWRSSSVMQMLAFVLATGMLSGLLPALALARFKPALVIKGAGLQQRSSSLPRAGVTVVQFGFSTALILLALAIVMQVRHLNTMDIGFDKDNLLVIDTGTTTDAVGHAAMVRELREYPGIVELTTTIRVPPVAGLTAPFALPSYGPNETRNLNWLIVDTKYFATLGLKLVAGRWFSDELATDFQFGRTPAPEQTADALPSVVITRQAARTLGFDSPAAALDQVINQRFPVTMPPNRVIGVVDDFHFSGGLDASPTHVLRASTNPNNVLMLRLDPRQQQNTLAFIDEVWARHHPGLPINRSFFSDTYNNLVARQTQGLSIAASFASVVTILISAMGLYALVFYSTARRTKEVGIRKVLGATTRMVIRLLTWDFLKPVLLACALACVGGYLAIQWYTQQFASRVEITPVLYLLVTGATLLMAVLIIIGISWRAASVHPVQSLRYE